MKIIISRKILDKELTKVSKPVTSNSILPSLSGILFNVDSDKLVLIGSNGITTIKSEIFKSAEILEITNVGSIILPIKYILEIVKKLDSDKIIIELLNDNIIKIYNNKSNFTISGIPADQYPKFDFSLTDMNITLGIELIKKIDKQIGFATAIQNNRPILKGINIKSDGNLTITATDSFRLARKLVDEIHNDFDLTIPKNVISDIIKIIDTDNKIKLFIKNKNLLFTFDNIKIISKIIEGSYPDTNKLIPKEFSRELTVNRRKLISAIERVTLISSDARNIVKFNLDSELFEIISSSGDMGQGIENVMEYELVGEKIEISMNSNYLLNALKTFDEETIIIRMTTDTKPLIITNLNDYELVQLILPIRTY